MEACLEGSIGGGNTTSCILIVGILPTSNCARGLAVGDRVVAKIFNHELADGLRAFTSCGIYTQQRCAEFSDPEMNEQEYALELEERSLARLRDIAEHL